MSDIRINIPPEIPEPSDQIVVHGEQSNYPPMREGLLDFPEGHVRWGKPEEAVVQVSLGPKAYRAVTDHVRGDTHREVGGLLLGQVFRGDHSDVYQVTVDEALPDYRGIGTRANFAFTFKSWSVLRDEAEERFPDYRIVGWYHSHPDLGVWFSGTDKKSHQTYFDKPWLVGLVVDPIRNMGAFFGDDKREVKQLPGFYERVEDEGSFITWNNIMSRPQSRRAPIPATELPVPQISPPLSFRTRLAQEVPLHLVFPLLIVIFLSLSALFLFIVSYLRLDTRIRELEDRTRTQENIMPNGMPLSPADPESVQESHPEAIPTPVIIRPFVYTVVEGDTVESIARRYNVTVEAILNSNRHIQDANHLTAGQRIIIPR